MTVKVFRVLQGTSDSVPLFKHMKSSHSKHVTSEFPVTSAPLNTHCR